MSSAPPSRSLPNLEWLRKAAKSRLRVLREQRPEARLADAQLLLAREYGFPSWRALKAAVDAALAEQPARRYRVDAADEVSAPWLKLVASGDVGLVSAALDRVPHLVHVTGPHPYWGGRPQALHVAIERKDREMFEMLLARGADPSGRTDEYDGWSPLMLAANREQPEMMRALVKYGAHVGLYEALMMGDDRQLRRLLAAGAPALAGSVPNNGSPLMFARTPFAIRRLVELGAPLDRADRWGATPIQALSALGKSGAALVTPARGALVGRCASSRSPPTARCARFAPSPASCAPSPRPARAGSSSSSRRAARWMSVLRISPRHPRTMVADLEVLEVLEELPEAVPIR